MYDKMIPHSRARKMPTPVVSKAVVSAPIDLKPAGNTIALTAPADNPFNANQPISIHTQLSGGMSPAPQSMKSRSFMHTMLPGVGESATETGTPVAQADTEKVAMVAAGQPTDTQLVEAAEASPSPMGFVRSRPLLTAGLLLGGLYLLFGRR